MSNALSDRSVARVRVKRRGAGAGDFVPAWHTGFLKLLPAIVREAQIRFRHLSPEARAEAVQEVLVSALIAYARLVHLGKEEVAYAAPLARFAVAQYCAGRRVSTPLNIRDVTSPYCRRRKNVEVERLDRWDERNECWREVLVEDRTCTPAELAASRIDFAAWMASLPPRNRRIARTLAAGESTKSAARRFRLSPARISQLRGELRDHWRDFHAGQRNREEAARRRTSHREITRGTPATDVVAVPL